MPNSQKGFAPILLLIGIVAIAIIGGTYYFGKSQVFKSQPQNPGVTSQDPKPIFTPQSTSTPNGTANPDLIGANWKIYTGKNINIGVSFRYPSDWNLSEGEKTVYSVYLEKDPDMREVLGACPGYFISVSPFDRTVNYAVFSPVQKGVFNGESVDIYENTNKYGCYTKVIFIHQFPTDSIKPKLVISLISRITKPVVFDQILSTFKFLPATEEGKFCGGIAGRLCAEGYTCQLDGNYPDAGGKCVKE